MGHAVLCGEKVIGNSPFAVLLGDEIMVSQKGELTTTAELAKIYEDTQSSTVAVMQVPDQDVSKYGIADVEKIREGYFKVKGFIEKPSLEKAPSRWALPGRYVFSPEIFEYLKKAKPGVLGEIQLTDSMNELAKDHSVFASQFSSQRYDAGDKLGYLKANVELGLQHPEVQADLRKYILELAQNLKGKS